ncbi:hypothetical protein MAR_017504 [Mya arenaria]|uniref:Uncharacterized protein n=1 Tax=Mya arenaria TaxID=6604 RepID=A0ABY7EFG9_MYAAR|nr:hypothetical protein MAR_017504 [Mya arenaria]
MEQMIESRLASCSDPCGSWSACSVTCGSGYRGRKNRRGCHDEETCTQPICPETRVFTTKEIYQGSVSTVSSTTFDISSPTERHKIAEPPKSSNSFKTVAITVPIVCVMLLILIVVTVYLVLRRRNRQQPDSIEQERNDKLQEAITPGTGYYNIEGQRNDGGYYNVCSSVTDHGSMENRRVVTPNSCKNPNKKDKENDQAVQNPENVSQYEKLQQAIYQNNETNDEPTRI